jgi:small subunit ribosomal protein S8
MRHDPLSDAFAAIKNAESVGKNECIVRPASRLVRSVLGMMQKKNYIGSVEEIKDGKGDMFRIELLGKINNCNIIKPRFSLSRNEFIKWEKRYLPSQNMGMLIMTTSRGVMSHEDAKKTGIGGCLLGFVY